MNGMNGSLSAYSIPSFPLKQTSHNHPSIMANLKAKAKFIMLIAPILCAAAPLVSAQGCPADRPAQLCCRTFAPFVSKRDVWENVCDIKDVELSMSVVSFCEEDVPW
jgi:hypothetical protein